MFNGRRVASMLKEEESGWSNLSPLLNREGYLGPFILDTLIQFGDQLSNQHLVNFDRLLKAVDQRSDYDLLQPHKDATVIASQISDGGYDGYSRGLEAIECHVKKMYIKWTDTTASESQSSSPRRSPTKGRDAYKPKGDAWRKVARAYVEGPTDPSTSVIPNVNAVKASFAYAYYKNPKFAFTVAYKDLCAIKASASQNLPITREFGEAMSIVPSFLRVLGQSEGD
jgi:RNA-dependent RNA polymerase